MVDLCISNAGLTLALIQTGSVLKNPGINEVTSTMALLLVIACLVFGVLRVNAVWRGQILLPRHGTLCRRNRN